MPEALRILREVADALATPTRTGVVHRDIKPDNVLLSGGHAVVTDFGVAKAVTAASGGSSLTSLGRRARHAGVHGAGAGRGRSARRPSGRPLRARRPGLRDAHRRSALHRHEPAAGARGPRDPGARAARRAPAGLSARARRAHHALPREAPSRSLAERERTGSAARWGDHAHRRDDAHRHIASRFPAAPKRRSGSPIRSE